MDFCYSRPYSPCTKCVRAATPRIMYLFVCTVFAHYFHTGMAPMAITRFSASSPSCAATRRFTIFGSDLVGNWRGVEKNTKFKRWCRTKWRQFVGPSDTRCDWSFFQGAWPTGSVYWSSDCCTSQILCESHYSAKSYSYLTWNFILHISRILQK